MGLWPRAGFSFFLDFKRADFLDFFIGVSDIGRTHGPIYPYAGWVLLVGESRISIRYSYPLGWKRQGHQKRSCFPGRQN